MRRILKTVYVSWELAAVGHMCVVDFLAIGVVTMDATVNLVGVTVFWHLLMWLKMSSSIDYLVGGTRVTVDP